MDRGPVTVRILQTGRDLVPVDRLVGFERVLRLGLHAEGDPEIADVADRIVLLGQNLCQRLTGVLVVMRDIVVEIGLDRLEHRGPVRPLRGAVVADDVGRELIATAPARIAQAEPGQSGRFSCDKLRFRKMRTALGTKYSRRMKDLRRRGFCPAAKPVARVWLRALRCNRCCSYPDALPQRL